MAQDNKSYWNRQATLDIPEEELTLKDFNQRELELGFITRSIGIADSLLEVGCGNGYSTRTLSKYAKQVSAIDYSEEMIKRAKENNRDLKNVTFKVADVLDLNAIPIGEYDVVVSERCLINLTSWEDQKIAIRNIYKWLRPEGKFIFVEGSQTGLGELNVLRTNVGLQEIKVASYNLNFRNKPTLDFLSRYFKITCIEQFGLYDIITRVVHPALVYPSEPEYDSRINGIARTVQCNSHEEIGYCSRVIGIEMIKKVKKNG